jgi:class 3 adenylate cyclase/tetratricopeptide (TPR) repeat protein
LVGVNETGEPVAELPSGTVTFLFTDVEGSTEFWDQTPDAMSAALQRHDALIDALVAEHHGVVVQPRGEGDSKFAVFPRASDAVVAAGAVQRALRAETWPTPRPLRVRIALHTGEAEQRQGLYYGLEVNRCARLRGLARGGETLLSAVTAGLVQDSLRDPFRLRELGEQQLRGIQRPERVYQLLIADLAESTTEPATQPSVAIAQSSAEFVSSYPFPTPVELLGRGAELEAVERLLDRLVDQPASAEPLLLIGAPAGTGKSAFLGAVVERARRAGALCLVGGAYLERGVGQFHDALAEYLLTQPPEQLRAALGPLAPDLAEAIPELRYHLALAEVPAPGEDLYLVRLFAAVLAYLRVLSSRQPVVICLEDLQAATAPTTRLIQYLVRQRRGLPFLIVGSYRDGEQQPSPSLTQLLSWVQRERPGPHLRLAPLDLPGTSRLAAALLNGPASERLSRSLYAATQGNPLFVEQLILALGEAGQLERRGGVWDGTAQSQTQLPPVIRDVIAQRLDRLSPSCRETLSLAAVLGETVAHRLLLASRAGDSETVLLADLDEALQARLLQETPTGYAFSHALLRSAIYADLSGPARMRLHRLAAETLERLAGERALDQATELAHHFSLAGESEQVRARALRYNLLAGRRAASLSAYRESFALFSRACELVAQSDSADPAVELEALEGRAVAERQLGIWTTCIATCRSMLDRCDESNRRARVHSMISRALRQLGETGQALAEAETALAELGDGTGDAESSRVRLQLMYDQAYLYYLRGRFKEALALGQRMLAAAERLGWSETFYWSHAAIAIAAMSQGDFALAERHYRLAVAATERVGDRAQQAVYFENLGVLHYRAGHFEAAVPLLEQAIALYRDTASDLRAVYGFRTLGWVKLAQGDLAGATEQVGLGLAVATEAQDRWAADCYGLLGGIQTLSGELDQAASAFEQALAMHERIGWAAATVDSLLGLGLIEERRGRPVEAASSYRRAVEVAEAMDPCPEQVAAKRHLGRLLVRQGQADLAAPLLQSALTLVESMRPSVEYGPTLLALAELANPGQRLDYVEQSLAAGGTAEHLVEAHLAAAAALAPNNSAAAAEQRDAARRLAERTGAAHLFALVAAG